MKNNLTYKFQQKKKQLLLAFDILAKSNFLPVTLGNITVDSNEVDHYKTKLLSEKFYISVCGQINAGKSTLLNHLLFNDKQILPVAATPWTAKLTKISYGNEDYAKVNFYSKKEWEELKNMVIIDENDNKVNYFKKFLQEAVNLSANNGVYSKEYINDVAYSFIIEGFENLDDYISSAGLYTPFVSHIEIFIDNPIIRDVIIVDTPGINDPNEMRSRVTTEFISQSSAVLYLFYSAIPLGSADLDFIDKYLVGISASKIMFASAKCDLVKNAQFIADWIESNLKNNPELNERHFAASGKVFPFSTMAAIIQYKLDGQLPLSQDEEYIKNRILPDLLSNHGYINELIKGIEQNLMNEKGSMLIDDATEKIIAICTKKIKDVQSDISLKQQLIIDLSLSMEDIGLRISQMKEVARNIKALMLNFKDRKEDLINKINEDILILKNDIISEAFTEYTYWINKKNVKKAIILSPHELKYILYQSVTKKINIDTFDSYFNSLVALQNEMKDTLKYNLKELVISNNWIPIFKPMLPVVKIIDSVIHSLDSIATELERAQVKRFFFLPDNDATRANISAIAAESIRKVAEKFSEAILDRISTDYDKLFLLSFEELDSYLNKYLFSLKDLSENFSKKSVDAEDHQEVLTDLKTEEARLQKCYQLILNEINID